MAINYHQDFEEYHIYHIYNKAVSNIKLFHSDAEYLEFLEKYKSYVSACFDTFAYCLMPNHFHFLVRVKSVEEIKKFARTQFTKAALTASSEHFDLNHFITDQFKRYFSSVGTKYKIRHTHQGSVFIERFKRVAASDIHKCIYWLTYIHHNPIHHGYVLHYHEWKFSSYNAYLTEGTTLIAKTEGLDWFGGIQYFIDYHNDFRFLPDPLLDP